MQLDRIVARLEADISHFQTGFARAQRSIERFQADTQTANRVARILQRGMDGLAFAAAGIPGPVGRAGSALLALGAGGPVAVAAIAGLGGIALAYKKLTAASEEAEKELRADAARIAEHLKIIAGAPETTLQAAADNLRDRIALLERRLSVPAGSINYTAARPGFVPPAVDEQAKRDKETLRGLRQELEAMNAALGVFSGRRHKALLEDLRGIEEEARDAGRAIQTELIPSLQQLMDLDTKTAFKGQKFGPKIFVDKDVQRAARDMKNELRKLMGDDKAQQDFQRIGENVGRLLADGVMEGFKDMAGFMRSLFSMVLNYAFGMGFGSLFGGGGKAAAAAAEGAGTGVINPVALSLEMPALSAPTTPFAIARDAEWQRVLRESMVVARSMGAK